jgi:hypothetical protein
MWFTVGWPMGRNGMYRSSLSANESIDKPDDERADHEIDEAIHLMQTIQPASPAQIKY